MCTFLRASRRATLPNLLTALRIPSGHTHALMPVGSAAKGKVLMRGWIVVYTVLGAASMGAVGSGVHSNGLLALGIVSGLLAVLSVASGTVRGRG